MDHRVEPGGDENEARLEFRSRLALITRRTPPKPRPTPGPYSAMRSCQMSCAIRRKAAISSALLFDSNAFDGELAHCWRICRAEESDTWKATV